MKLYFPEGIFSFYDNHCYVVHEETQELFCLFVCFKLSTYISEFVKKIFIFMTFCYRKYYSCCFQIVSKTLEESAYDFLIDECTIDSYVTGTHDSYIACGANRVGEGNFTAVIKRHSKNFHCFPRNTLFEKYWYPV